VRKLRDVYPNDGWKPPYSPYTEHGSRPIPFDPGPTRKEHIHQGICHNCQVRLDAVTIIDGPLDGWICVSGLELGHEIALEQAKMEAIGHLFELIDQARWAIEKLTAFKP
jgi:hypothetical protein